MPCPLHVHAHTLPPAGVPAPPHAVAGKWRACPRCGMRWAEPDGRLRVRKRSVAKVTALEASGESEEEEPEIPEEFEVSEWVTE